MSTEPDDTLTFAVVPDGPTETLPALPAGVEPAVPPPSLREIAHETIPWDRLPAMTAPQPEPEVTLALPAVTGDTEATPALEAVTEPVPAQEPEPVTFAHWRHYPIGDGLISSLPGFDIPPCGHCKARFTAASPDVLTAVRPLMELRYLAREAGWNYDPSFIWSCPECRKGAVEREAAEARAEAEAVALAEHEHRSLIAGFDHRAFAVMAARGWDFTCKWSYEPAAERQAA